MENYQLIHSKLTLESAACQLEKVLKLSQKSKATNRKLSDGELELMKNLCKADNNRICQLATEAFLLLATDGTVDQGQVLGILMTILPSSGPSQFNTIGSAIFELLLLDLRRRCSLAGTTGRSYVCQFDLKAPQHPVIQLLEKCEPGCMIIFLEMITATLDGHNSEPAVRDNCVEFLRPVLLHLFVNVRSFPDCYKLWRLLVVKATRDPKAEDLLFEILGWRRDTTASQTCYTVSLLVDGLDALQGSSDDHLLNLRLEIAIYLAAILKEYIGFNNDPTRCLNVLEDVCEDALKYDPVPQLDVLLLIFVDLLTVVSPMKQYGLVKIISSLFPSCGAFSRMMAKEAMIQLLGQPSYATQHLPLCDKILKDNSKELVNRVIPTKQLLKATYYHTGLAKWALICNWTSSYPTALDEYFRADRSQHCPRFSSCLGSMYRAIFVTTTFDDDVWRANFRALVAMMKGNDVQATQCMIPLLYGLAQQQDPGRRLHILQTLAATGAKENVIGILKAMTKDLDRATCLDLYLRLWKAEPRTYPLLYDLLKDTSRPPAKADLWEHTVARAYTIREVCLIKPQQHGEDLVNLFSEILSNPNDADNEVAVCLSLDAISSLCEHQVVNIVSTWKVLGFRFANESRTRVIRCLCRFFANVPLIKVTSQEQERLVNHIIGTLWHYVTDYDDGEIIGAALATLKHFNPNSLTLRQIPELFRQGIDLPEPSADDGISIADSPGSVPPECWIQLVQYTNLGAIDAAGDLVAYYIAREMETFRGGVYQTPEGRPEPSNLKYLPRASILSTIVNYLIAQSTKFATSSTTSEQVLVQLLRIVAKKYSKPIPPLNWCFLHEYFLNCFEMRDYCVQIAIKQMPYSGTAKRMLENYLNELCETVMLEEDLVKIFAHLEAITETVQTPIYKRFVHLSLHFLAERAEDKRFADSSAFLQTLELVGKVLEGNCNNESNFEVLCETLKGFFGRFDHNTQIFRKYIDVLVLLPRAQLDDFPTVSEDASLTVLQKKIYFEFAVRKQNPTITMMPVVESIAKAVTSNIEDSQLLIVYFLEQIYEFVQCFNDSANVGKPLIIFIDELISSTQSALVSMDLQSIRFMLDAFMMSVISFSGWGTLYGAYSISFDRSLRMQLFPVALVKLFEQNYWREIEIKIYEVLYHLHGVTTLPSDLAECFRNTLICCKKQPYFQQSKSWPKYASMRRS
ncbi:focadhesin-like [Anopheles albimanus]|uniref:focadhesin-like n=1 Tax=Anopheles albimanus TaxID=7167 RepID=UPI00163FB19B|nr:focadhesin-like [Anopheles albimanus]